MVKYSKKRNPIQLFIVEDHPGLLESLCLYFGTQDDITLCGSASSSEQALNDLQKCSADVVCTDFSFPNMDGIEFIIILRQKHPLIRSMVFSAREDSFAQDRAREVGAYGFVIKGKRRPEHLADCIRAVAAGGCYFDSDF